MVFDWFRRRQQAETPKTPETPETPDQAPENVTETEQAEAVSSDDIATDYLSWAKAAYQNVQKQQVEIDVTETIPSTAETPLAEIEPPSPLVETTTDEQEAMTGQMLDQTSPAEDDLPFWAKTEAERQARLEKLKETAREEPEVLSFESEPEEKITIPKIAFDADFIWSAEVLAAQGRTPEQVSIEEITWLQKLRRGLGKTRRNLINQLRAIVGQGPLNQDGVRSIEELLLQADVGVAATDYIIETLQNKLLKEVLPPDQAIAYLKEILRDILEKPYENQGKSVPSLLIPTKGQLNIWLITGVNGAGKTTTIGKLARLAIKSDYKCLIAAADTFRAAAVEQLKVWGSRSQVEVIANPGQNTDPASVVFDAITAAQARQAELLLVDTAGRLQNKKNLMDELGKVRKIVDKKAPGAIVESLLVLDATLGQNGLRQAEVFSEVAQLSGVILTKLDGSAKGGVALAIVKQLGLPIRFIGVGESIEDLRPFSSYEFVEALLSS